MLNRIQTRPRYASGHAENYIRAVIVRALSTHKWNTRCPGRWGENYFEIRLSECQFRRDAVVSCRGAEKMARSLLVCPSSLRFPILESRLREDENGSTVVVNYINDLEHRVNSHRNSASPPPTPSTVPDLVVVFSPSASLNCETFLRWCARGELVSR